MDFFHPVSGEWFGSCFDGPTTAQAKAWPAITRGESTLLLAPTGSGKTLAAFFCALDRLMFKTGGSTEEKGVRVLYISPLKALAVDVQRNLRAPLTGLSALAVHKGVAYREVSAAIRTGDTPQKERARMRRNPPDILITTPESLYLLLTSGAREILRTVDTVIVDEIHHMVGSKRGVHLALSLERLESERIASQPLQRIGLSATQKPLEETSRLLAGYDFDGDGLHPRPVTIVDAGEKKIVRITVEVPVEDMAFPARGESKGTGEGGDAAELFDEVGGSDNLGNNVNDRSIWPAIYPRLVELIGEHRSTIIFVNSRRSAERLAEAINEQSEADIAKAHHGSLSQSARAQMEDELKAGRLPAIVATSSLELGIDMGAVELVIMVEAPPSIASGLQRIGRAQHHVGGVPRGVTFPKFRSDLIACAASTRAMLDGNIESSYYPRNPLDVLAQQMVATVSMHDEEPLLVDELFNIVRRAAPYAELSRTMFESVLDMSGGRYPADEFADLRPLITWDRLQGTLTPRKSARRVAVINGGTIPDRGLYGVFLAGGEEGRSKRVGELDEEMVFESRVGEVFVLGASSWRIEEITHDRVLVTPAPGEPGKMPFWHGDGPGRPLEFGKVIGAFIRRFAGQKTAKAKPELMSDYGLDQKAAANLMAYLDDQAEAAAVPTDKTIVVERFFDEIGDRRICVLSPLGSRVHAPWALAARAKLIEQTGMEPDVVWSDDGIVFRLDDSDTVADLDLFLPEPDEVEERIIGRLPDTSLFAARFRENAARALLLTKKRPGGRTPLWAMRRRSAGLLQVAARYKDFPVILETYRECLQDQFDLGGLKEILTSIRERKIKVIETETRSPSPFAAALMFQYVGNFMYEGDAPLAERRAQALTIDQSRLRELLGEAALRELLDADAIAAVGEQLLRHTRVMKHSDDVHDLLLAVGPLTEEELEVYDCRSGEQDVSIQSYLDELKAVRRVVNFKLGANRFFSAAEDAARLRDGLGVPIPPGLPEALLEQVEDPLGDLVMRYARTHGPFTTEDLTRRFGLGSGVILPVLKRLQLLDKIYAGEFIPGSFGREWCHSEVLRRIKRMSLSRLRAQVEPVEQPALSRFSLDWHALGTAHRGPDAVLDAIEKLQGLPLPASVFENEILAPRVRDYRPSDLDAVCISGEVIWRGIRPSGPKDGKIALYLASHFPLLQRTSEPLAGEVYDAIRAELHERGGLFFAELLRAGEGLTPAMLLEHLWDLVWNGEVSNDTPAPLRSLLYKNPRRPRRTTRRYAAYGGGGRVVEPGSEGRWWLVAASSEEPTVRRTALVEQLLERYGVLTREVLNIEEIEGGFSSIYPVLKAMEERGRIRRGYFVDGLGATQFALPGAEDRLRRHNRMDEEPGNTPGHAQGQLAATDPANIFGAAVAWPEDLGGRPERAPGARVFLEDGELIAFLSRSGKSLWIRPAEDREHLVRRIQLVAGRLGEMLTELRRPALSLEKINGESAASFEGSKIFTQNGFVRTTARLVLRRAVLSR